MATRKKVVPSTTFVVPDTIEGVISLLTARKFEKAACVYAYTAPDKPGPKAAGDRTENRTIYGIREFAKFGISGLRSAEDVGWYRQQWVKGIEDGWAEPVGPGDVIDVPDDLDWPPTGHDNPTTPHDEEFEEEAAAAGVSVTQAKRVASNTKAVKAAIKADPATRVAAYEAIEEAEQAEASKPKATKTASKNGKAKAPDQDFLTLVVQLRKAKKALHESLGLAADIRGIAEGEKRDSVSAIVDSLRMHVEALDQLVKGDSIDVELSRLLESEVD